jgi:hypothetical protein
MGNQSSRLSVKDGSPLLTHDRITLHQYIKASHLISILPSPIIDIIVDYYKTLQRRILSFGLEKASSHAIGWLSSELPPRNGILGTPRSSDPARTVDDVDGYRLIYGTCPLQHIQHSAIINDSLYLFGRRTREQESEIISCSMNDIYASSLASTIPSSIDDVKTLIKWRINRAPPTASLSTGRTCVWHGRWCFIADLHCSYYDTITDQWYPLPIPTGAKYAIPSAHYGHMYVTSATGLYIYTEQSGDYDAKDDGATIPRSSIKSTRRNVVRNMNGRWQKVDTMDGRHGSHLISPSLPLPLPHLASSSLRAPNQKGTDDEQPDDIIFIQGKILPPGRTRHSSFDWTVPYMEQFSPITGLAAATEWNIIKDKKKPSWLSIWSNSSIVVIDHQWLLFLPKQLFMHQQQEQPQLPCLCRWNDISQIRQYRWYPSLPRHFHHKIILITGQDGSGIAIR